MIFAFELGFEWNSALVGSSMYQGREEGANKLCARDREQTEQQSRVTQPRSGGHGGGGWAPEKSLATMRPQAPAEAQRAGLCRSKGQSWWNLAGPEGRLWFQNRAGPSRC